MTREEEIRQASIEYTMENAPKCIGGDNFSEVMDGMNRNHAFEKGAKWADNHSKYPWISVNEKLPPEEEDGLSIKVLVISTKGKIDFSRYDYNMKGWISPILDIEFTHWMYLPKLPKE